MKKRNGNMKLIGLEPMAHLLLVMLRFRDNFKSYYGRGVLVIVGAALLTPAP